MLNKPGIYRLMSCLLMFSAGNAAWGEYLLENSRLKAVIEPVGCIIEISDEASGTVYITEQVHSFIFQEATSSPDTCYLSYRVFPDDFTMEAALSLDENALVFRLTADSDAAMSKQFKFPGAIESRDGDYYVVPHASGYISPVDEPFPLGIPRGRFHMWGYKATMPFAGITDLETGYMIVSDDPWDTEISIARPTWSSPNHSLMLNHHPSKGAFGYDRTFYMVFFDNGGYVSMCEWYRDHADSRGYLRTLRDKAIDNPLMNRLIGAVDFWTFSSYRAGDLIDSLSDYGFDRVLYTFTTNYVTFPDNSSLIEKAHNTGYLTSRYDCFTDVYPDIHPEVNWLEREGYPENVIINADGSRRKGWVTYLSDGTAFQGYHTCSKTHVQYARRKISRDLTVNDYTARFIDVELASVLTECYSDDHPATRHDDAVFRAKTLEVVKEDFNLITGSEEARDFAFPWCDYSEGTLTMVAPDNAGYDWRTPLDDPGERFIDISMNAARRIPLHSLVYHDTHVATWYTGDGVSKVPAYWDHKDLFTILYGTMQLFMPVNMEHWKENIGRFVTSYQATNAVFRNVGYERMTSHEMLSQDFTVQKTTFSNGWTVVANFGSSDYSYNGRTLPPLGFYAGNGGMESMRVEENGGTYTAVRLSDRLFFNPYGRRTEFNGVRSVGPVFLRHEGNGRIHLAFVGGLQSVDLKPESLPWPAESIRVFEKNGEEIKVSDVGDGWLRIQRPGSGDCLNIEFDPAVSVDDPDDRNQRTPLLSVHPNPFNAETTVTYSLAEPGRISIDLFNLVGQKVAVLQDSYMLQGTYQKSINSGGLTSGIYFVRLRTGKSSLTQKLLLVK